MERHDTHALSGYSSSSNNHSYDFENKKKNKNNKKLISRNIQDGLNEQLTSIQLKKINSILNKYNIHSEQTPKNVEFIKHRQKTDKEEEINLNRNILITKNNTGENHTSSNKNKKKESKKEKKKKKSKSQKDIIINNDIDLDEPKKEEIKIEEPKKEEIKIEETKIEEPKKEEIKKEEIKKEEIKKEEIKIEEPKKEEIKKEEIKIEEPKKEEIKKEETKKEETNKEDTKKEENKKEEIKKEEIKKEEVKKDETKKEEIKKNEAKKDETKKEDKKGEIKKGEIKKEEIKKEVIKKEEPKKEIIKKEEPKKEENKKEDKKITNNNQKEKEQKNISKENTKVTQNVNKSSLPKNTFADKIKLFSGESTENTQKKNEDFKMSNKIKSIATKMGTSKPVSGINKLLEKLNSDMNRNIPKKQEFKETEEDKELEKEKEKEKKFMEKFELKSTTLTPKYISLVKNDKSIEEDVLILKDNLNSEYIENLYQLFLLWSLNLREAPGDKLELKKSKIENIYPLELMLNMVTKTDSIDYISKSLKNIEQLSDNSLNAEKICKSDNMIRNILTLGFKFYKSDDKIQKKCYNIIKTIILNIFLNPLENESKTFYPFEQINVIFIWGDYLIFKDLDKKTDDSKYLTDFLNEIFSEILTLFKIKYEPSMDISKTNVNSNPGKNYFARNYFIFITHLFHFCFNFNLDKRIKTEGANCIQESPKIYSNLTGYISGMRFMEKQKKKINEIWLDFPFFDDICKRMNMVTSKIKGLISEKNKCKKYEHIINQILLDKAKKNVYQKELEFICYEEKDKGILPLIQIVPIGILCLLHYIDEKETFDFWIKELKKFLRFIIIASTNLVRTNQLEVYNNIQEKCLYALCTCIAFLKELYDKTKHFHDKIGKLLKNTLIFCFLIVKYQIGYSSTHKGKKIIKITKYSRNDLIQCAAYMLFGEKIKNKDNLPLVDKAFLDNNYNSQYENMIDILNQDEWTTQFFENEQLKKELSEKYLEFNRYVDIVNKRIQEILIMEENNQDNFSEDILGILPNYENELMKYSNNNLEKNKKFKMIYKRHKKRLFSWNGLWSDRKLFFEYPEQLKYKMMNHLTKTLMKPLIVPILDLSYYLPEFSGFDASKLFYEDENSEHKNDKFKLVMDIDKILKSSEKSLQKLSNLDDNVQENFLRKIYVKSNPKLAKSLAVISKKLDFGKEEEFAMVKDQKVSKIKYFLSCLVKTSHHIKGVSFIDSTSLNFKVFVNQRAGNAMTGVEIGFTTEDDDYDHDRHTCFGSYFICHPKDKDLYKISIKYSEIKLIFKRIQFQIRK